MKSRAKSLLKRLHRLQSDIYNYQSYLEDQSGNAKSMYRELKYKKAAELAGESGFELDLAQNKMEYLIELLDK